MKGFTALMVWIISNKANNPLRLRSFCDYLSTSIGGFLSLDMAKPKIIINIKPTFCIIPTLKS